MSMPYGHNTFENKICTCALESEHYVIKSIPKYSAFVVLTILP